MRWLLAGTFSPAPSGRSFAVSGERFSDVIEGCRLSLTVEVADHLGAAQTRAFELTFARPRDFRVEAVRAHATLRALDEIAEALARPREPITIDEAAKRVHALVGDGVLLRALDGRSEPTTEAASSIDTPATPVSESNTDAAAPSGARDGVIDAIFSKAAVPEGTDAPLQAARSGLDAFVGAMRGQGSKRPKPAAQTLDAAAIIRAGVERTALAILAHPQVTALEQTWRGLRMVMAESPGHDELVVTALDVGADTLPTTLEQHLLAIGPDLRPDAVFVTHAADDPSLLSALARVAARSQVVVVAGVTPSITGFALRTNGWPEEPAPEPEPWAALRADAGSEWLVVSANPVVVVAEPLASGARVVEASPAFAVAALLSGALARSGTLVDAIGRRGAVRAPAARDIDVRGVGAVTLPTRWPAAVEALAAAAERGLALLGHDRDQILLASAPTTAAAQPRQLPAQILLGRARRIVSHVRRGLRPDASARELERALDEAAATFLPRGPRGSLHLQPVSTDGKMQVDVRLGEDLAGSALALEIDFDA